MANATHDSSNQKQLKVLVPLAQGCEELEAVTITDLLTRAGMNIVTVGLDKQPVIASRGMVLMPQTTIDTVMDEDFDLIVLPGGLPGADHLQNDVRIQSKLKSMAADNKTIAAICAAPKALGSAGVLDGKKVPCYPGALDEYPQLNVRSTAIEIDGQIVTSRGPGTAMDFTLSLIELLEGKIKRDEIERQLVR